MPETLEALRIERISSARRPALYDALMAIDTLDGFIDAPETKRNVISFYGDNKCVERAIKGEQGLEDAFMEVSSKFEGWKSYVPHMRNEEHSKRVLVFDDVIRIPVYMAEYGHVWLSQDNPISALIGNGITSTGFAYVLYRGAKFIEDNKIGFSIIRPDVLMWGLPIFATGCAIYSGSKYAKNRAEFIERAKIQAQEIDKDIRELFS